MSTRTVLAATFLTLASTLSAAITGITVFGDSLSDIGNVGRATNGLLWNEQIGYPTSPSDSGGNIYARGSATSVDIAAQIGAYSVANGGTADNSTSHIIFIGGNDLNALASLALINPGAIPAEINTRVTNIVTAASSLQLLGANNIRVVSVPDVSLTPLVRSNPLASPLLLAQIAGVVDLFNASLLTGLGTLPGDSIQFVDINPAFRDAFNNPSNYGLTNVTGTITGDTPPNPDQYLFFDGFHPSSAIHGVLGNIIATSIPEPSSLTLLVLASGVLLRRRR